MQFLHPSKTSCKLIVIACLFSLVFSATYANAQAMEPGAQENGQPFSDSEEKARIVIFDWFGGLINIAQGVGWLGGLGVGAYGLKAAWDAYKEGQVRRRNEDWGKEFSRRSGESKLISNLKKDKPYRRFRISLYTTKKVS